MKLEQFELPEKNEQYAKIITNQGDISIRLFPKIAPKAVENFTTHAKDGYYNGVIFHRIINDFMIQGGDPDGTGRGGQSIWGNSFEDEFDPFFRNFRGALSMANAGPNTNGSQFFIVQKREVEQRFIDQMKSLGDEEGFYDEIIKGYAENGGTFWLDGKHTVFGHVIKGLDIVDKIAGLPVGYNDRPIEDVVIEKIEILDY